jgi:flagellar hook-basal body complex protein FliE
MQVDATGKMGLLPSPLASPPSTTSASPGKSTFQQMLADVNSQQRQADVQVQRSLLGDADIHEATMALEKVDLSLRLLVQVRNKLVSAYEELSRMSM